MAGVFPSAVLRVLLEKLASLELLKFATQVGVSFKLLKWENALTMINAVLIDAEEKQLTNAAVKVGLAELQDLFYDAEDILDECAAEGLSRKLKIKKHRASTSRARKLIPACSFGYTPRAIKSTVSMLSEIDGITSRLKGLCNRVPALGLTVIAKQRLTDLQRPPTASLQMEPVVYGRHEDKAKILEMVLRDGTSHGNFGVISIVGLGGIGKTTLAREVYKHKSVLENFNLRGWFCLGYDSNVFRISKTILNSITPRSFNLENFNQVRHLLKESIAGRKFLFVLDDVWIEGYTLWENFCSAFIEGAPGSKIIITTCVQDVAFTAGRGLNVYLLNHLSDEDCWLTFAGQANASEYQHLEAIREKVVEKCKGLPLAARILGGLLRFKERDEWEDILNSKLWDLHNEQSGIFPLSKLCYYHLPSHLKRCFAYCAILPRHYEFKEEELVLLWVAEGLIQQSNDTRQLEELGSEYFHDLVSRSIFQKSDGADSKFVMHSLIHDLAVYVSGGTSIRLEGADMSHRQLSKRILYCSYSGCFYVDKEEFEGSSALENLRTFLLVHVDGHTLCEADNHLSRLLSGFKKLRVLSLRNYDITMVPDSIRNMRSLRYLNLSGTAIRTLPESTNMLFNLQVLLLRDCFCLVRLPYNMGNLINLRRLDITGKSVGSSIKALKNSKFLNGKLCISSLENVIDSQKEILLIDKKGLEVLILEWGSLFDDSRNEAAENDVLDMLQPHQNLKELTIRCYGGIHFPSWLGDPSFSNMVVLRLENCERCTSLPSLGQLGSLKELIIRGMKGLKRIGSEIYGRGYSKPFQSLENLLFEDLDECEHWNPIGEAKKVEVFSCLRKLSVIGCPKLTGTLPDHLPSLQELVIHECPQLTVSFSSLPMIYMLEVDRGRAILSHDAADYKSLNSISPNISQLSNWLKQVFQNVECLKIVNCEELIYFWQNEILPEKLPQELHGLIALRELCIENCSNLTAIPEVDFLSVLSILKIENCNALMSLPVGLQHNNACLQYLRIGGCHSLKFIFSSQLPSSLKRLEVKNCEKLQHLFDDGEIASASSQSSSPTNRGGSQFFLEHLFVSQCPLLTCLSSRLQSLPVLNHLELSRCAKLVTLSSSGQLRATLQHLSIVDCPKLESIAESFQSNMSLEFIKIWSCKKLKLIPENLDSLSCLHDMYIWDCPSLVSFPEGGLPHSNLKLFSINKCRELRALPDHMHNLNSLQELELRQCPSITSIEEGLPTSLTSLSIADVSICRPLLEWGFNNLTSLKNLEIRGCVYAESFLLEETGMILPTSLTVLTIARFPKLKYLSSEGLQKLPALEHLSISDCPALISLPEPCLPSSLQQLYIYNCLLLETRCERDTGEDWSKISHIPCIQIDGIFI